jgi:hypothetical protein
VQTTSIRQLAGSSSARSLEPSASLEPPDEVVELVEIHGPVTGCGITHMDAQHRGPSIVAVHRCLPGSFHVTGIPASPGIHTAVIISGTTFLARLNYAIHPDRGQIKDENTITRTFPEMEGMELIYVRCPQ